MNTTARPTPVEAADDGSTLPTTVLIAEDEHLVATDLAEHLRHLGVEVIGPVADGRQAIEMSKQRRPDMALVDIRMPGTNGLDAAEVLFNQMGIPIVIVSAHTDPDYVDHGTRIGVFGYLLKPVTVDDLRVNLAVAWSRFQRDSRLRQRVDELKAALENRKLVERAKGLLMDRLGLGEGEAMRRLQKKARDSRRTMADLARAIIESDELLNEDQARRP